LECDWIAGCDGFYGVSRWAIPASALTLHEREHPYAWLGVLAQAKPSSGELVYTRHERGFALFSMRSPRLTRLYLQVSPDDDLDDWSDARIWDELHLRFKGDDNWGPVRGELLEKSIVGMRSFVAEPMRYKHLFLLGDAAHVVPPTGAKGMNLAIGDARWLATGLRNHYRNRDDAVLSAYSDGALYHVWWAQEFSLRMTRMLHRSPDGDEFDNRLQLAHLDHLVNTRASQTAFAEYYVGSPFSTDLRGMYPW
jgi:p-hydroxybenzoate 3-monooxygenase